jgi:two-component system chemotaxis response regulator CheB
VDVLFHSVSQEFGPTAVGVLMTGMGEDGAEGLGAIKAAGGVTLAQSEDTCVVPGMPRAAIVKGYVNRIVPLDAMGHVLITHFGGDKATQNSARQEKFDRSDKNRDDRSDKDEKIERMPASTNRS